MKKYIIQSSNFSGSVDVWYDEHGYMCFLNFGRFNGTSEVQKVLLTLIPRQLYTLEQKLNLTMFEVKEVENEN